MTSPADFLDAPLQPYSTETLTAKVGDALATLYGALLQQNIAPGGDTIPNRFTVLEQKLDALAAQVTALQVPSKLTGTASVEVDLTPSA